MGIALKRAIRRIARRDDRPPVCDAAGVRWYCLRTRPKSEHLAARSLRRLAVVETYCPRIRRRKVTPRGPVWFVEALFPGYLFARFDLRHCHRDLEYVSGVRGVVRFGTTPAAVPDGVIEALRQAAPENVSQTTAPPSLRPGDAAVVLEGPLMGLSVVVTRVMPACERVRVLLEFLGRRTETEMPTARLAPAADSGVPPALRRCVLRASR